MKYSIDTSILIESWVRLYAQDTFPQVWKKLDELIEQGNLIATEEVLFELERKEDKLYEWAKQRKSMFIPVDENLQRVVTDILSKHKKLVKEGKNRSSADPFVIALAQVQNCAVITFENPSGNMDKPKIPDVCSSLKIRCLKMLDLFREQKWKF